MSAHHRTKIGIATVCRWFAMAAIVAATACAAAIHIQTDFDRTVDFDQCGMLAARFQIGPAEIEYHLECKYYNSQCCQFEKNAPTASRALLAQRSECEFFKHLAFPAFFPGWLLIGIFVVVIHDYRCFRSLESLCSHGPYIFIGLPEYLIVPFNHHDRTQTTAAAGTARASAGCRDINRTVGGTHQIQAC